MIWRADCRDLAGEMAAATGVFVLLDPRGLGVACGLETPAHTRAGSGCVERGVVVCLKGLFALGAGRGV